MFELFNIRLLSAAIVAVLAFVSIEVSALEWVGNTLEGKPCDGKQQGFGPWDYFDINEPSDELWEAGRLWEIDVIHTGKAENLIRNSGVMGQAEFQSAIRDLDYSLRAIPNDPRALMLMIEVDEIRRSNRALTTNVAPPECYFQRAESFRPQQEHLHIIKGIYLNKRGLFDDEISAYRKALSINDEAVEAHYNVGLAYIKRGDLDNASKHAQKAYQFGYPLQGLRRKLEQAGRKLTASTN